MLTSLALTFKDALQGQSGRAITTFYFVGIIICVPVAMIVQTLRGLATAGASLIGVAVGLTLLELMMVKIYGREKILPEFNTFVQAGKESLEQQTELLFKARHLTTRQLELTIKLNRLQLMLPFLRLYGAKPSLALVKALRDQEKRLRRFGNSVESQRWWWRKVSASTARQIDLLKREDEPRVAAFEKETASFLKKLEFVSVLVGEIDAEMDRILELLDATVTELTGPATQVRAEANRIQLQMHADIVPKVQGSVVQLQRVMQRVAA